MKENRFELFGNDKRETVNKRPWENINLNVWHNLWKRVMAGSMSGTVLAWKGLKKTLSHKRKWEWHNEYA